MDLIITILPVVTKDFPISPRFTPYNFFSRCKFSTLTTRQPMVEFNLLTFPRFSLRKKEHKPYFGKNRTYDFRTSRCAGYLLDHSGDESFDVVLVKPIIIKSGTHTYNMINNEHLPKNCHVEQCRCSNLWSVHHIVAVETRVRFSDWTPC